MTTIQIPIEETLLTKVDRVIQSLSTTRADYVQKALKLALNQDEIRLWEKQHEESYARKPMLPEEIDEWDSVRVWEEP
ncbi:MAG: hypothetical protein AAB401_22605 [Acidobacteriota bacterium]